MTKLCQRDSHPHMVAVFRQGEVTDSAYYYIDMELCDSNLDKFMRDHRPSSSSPIQLPLVWNIIVQITSGLAFIHEHGEVHRDIKPRNGMHTDVGEANCYLVLYKRSENVWKITDFGLTSEGNSKTLHTTSSARGTSGYRPPEMLTEGKKGYSSKADVWSVGCIFYELLVGERPFPDDWSVIRYADSKASLGIPQHILHALDADWELALTTLIKALFQLDPQSRIPIVNLLRQCAFHYEQTCSDDSPLYLSIESTALPAISASPPFRPRLGSSSCSNTPYFAQLGYHNATIWKCDKGMSRTTTPKVGDLHERKQITAMALGKLRATGRVVIALSGLDSIIKVYDVDTVAELTRYRAVPRVTALEIDHDGGYLAYGTHDGRIVISNIQSHPEGVTLSPRSQLGVGKLTIERLGFHPKPDTLICAVNYFGVVVVNTFGTVFLRFGRGNLSLGHAHPFIYDHIFNPVRQEFLVCTEDRIWIYDLSTADGRCRFIEVQRCRGAIYSPCGNYILATYRDIIGVWDNSAGGDFLFDIPDIRSHRRAWFCNDEKGLCCVLDPNSDEVKLFNFTAEMKRMNVK